MARNTGTTDTTKKRGTSRRKAPVRTNPTVSERDHRSADRNGTFAGRTSTSASIGPKRKLRTSQKQASSQQLQSTPKQQQSKLARIRSSAVKQPASRGSKLTPMLRSPIVRNVIAAGLVSAAAALVYRKPKAVAAASGSIQAAAIDVLNGTVDAAHATTQKASEAGRKLTAASKAFASPSKNPAAQTESSHEGSLYAEDAAPANVEQRTRKRRSDAGTKRAPRKSLTLVDAPTGIAPDTKPALTSLRNMETSAFAFGSQSIDAAEPAIATDEPFVEAQSS